MCPDPLWEKYAGWTPYQYCRNNPVKKVDLTGLADFVFNGGYVYNDGVDNGQVYATSNFAYQASLEPLNVPGLQFLEIPNLNRLKEQSELLPNKETRNEICSYIFSRGKDQESGGAGTLEKFYWGGLGGNPGEATDAVINGINKAKADNVKSGNIVYTAHDHPFKSEINASVGDLNSFNWIDRDYRTNLKYNVLIYEGKVNIITRGGDQIIFSKELFKNLGK